MFYIGNSSATKTQHVRRKTDTKKQTKAGHDVSPTHSTGLELPRTYPHYLSPPSRATPAHHGTNAAMYYRTLQRRVSRGVLLCYVM